MDWTLGENKANSKPNKLVLSVVEWSQYAGDAKPAQSIPILINDNRDEAATQGTFEKTKPIYSYCVLRKSTGRLTAESQGLRDAYCEKEFEKTKPICGRAKFAQSLI